MYIVYIIYSKGIDRYYIGLTTDLEGRIRRHNAVHKKGFSGRANDWVLVYQELYETKFEALKREREIKSWKSRVLLEKLIRN